MSFEPDTRFRTPLSRLPIRLRLATGVSIVAFVILALFAVVVDRLEAHRLWADFYSQVDSNARIATHHLTIVPGNPPTITPAPSELGLSAGALVRVLNANGSVVVPAKSNVNLGPPAAQDQNVDGYRVVTEQARSFSGFAGFVQYAQPLTSVSNEVGDLKVFLLLGVLAGTVLAFGAGSLVARRAIMPIAELTAAAAQIERTRDLNQMLPEPTADDEVAELSRTLSRMLASLADARNETEALLERQRAFVADASHELRTPLTSVLANLELLADSLEGPDRDAALSALRSTQRMRRLVGDLLLLARADAHRPPLRDPVDLAQVVIEAASELEPAAGNHVLTLDVKPAPTVGSRDDLQRVATNLIENALRHTPPATHVTASTRALPDGGVELVVADAGPGIAPDVRATLFQRFVRGVGDRGGSFGLGLAIVDAVTRAHGGEIVVDESPHGGARFTVTLPPATPAAPDDPTQGHLWADLERLPAAPTDDSEPAGERSA
jgi:two-component system OmpR family sensor kinase